MEKADADKAEEAKEKLKTAMEGNNIDEIKTASEELEKVVQELSVKLYQQQAAQQQAEAQTDGGQKAKAQDDVVDAEYEVVDEDDQKGK